MINSVSFVLEVTMEISDEAVDFAKSGQFDCFTEATLGQNE